MREMSTTPNSKECSVSFVLAKARVAPLKGKWTIHRLELLAAVVAARLSKIVQESFPGRIDEGFLYSDNASVIGWLRDKPERWRPFVGNRIREITSI